MIRVLLVEDQAMVRGALAALLALEADIEIVAAVASVPAAEALLSEWAATGTLPDILLTDIELGADSGLDLAIRARERWPAMRVVILTTFARSGFLRRALDSGVRGYLLKDAPAEQLGTAIRNVQRGGRAIDPSLAAAAWDEPDPLTERERVVLRLAGDGQASADIARTLSLSEGTVRNYLSEAISKLGARNRTDAARLARDKGWL
ncbi:response regulator transcription factor [Permianibacter sp. IMCC34836]|uniref:response regulator transcription factor n=1 Tax=Permianibacter fluminis TaxID=2738515 RepID=UPI0015525107|nr:response regulator transcription factor [Permianibacter fluminis]NQD35635.1 response regulator transcription factor [Permianibacter fluminis]